MTFKQIPATEDAELVKEVCRQYTSTGAQIGVQIFKPITTIKFNGVPLQHQNGDEVMTEQLCQALLETIKWQDIEIVQLPRFLPTKEGTSQSMVVVDVADNKLSAVGKRILRGKVLFLTRYIKPKEFYWPALVPWYTKCC